MKRSLLIRFLSFPFCTSVHILTETMSDAYPMSKKAVLTSFTFSSTCRSEDALVSVTARKHGQTTHHVLMPVEGLHASQQLFVVTSRYENRIVVSDSLQEHRQRSLRDFLLFRPPDLLLRQL